MLKIVSRKVDNFRQFKVTYFWIDFPEEIDGDFVDFLLCSSDTLEVESFRFDFDFRIFDVLQTDRQENEGGSLSPHHRRRGIYTENH